VKAIDSDLRAIVEAALDEVRRYRKKGVAIEVRLGDAPLRLMADPIQLQEAVVNLVRNAIDATVRGSVGVRLEERPGFYAIVVTDTGSGMSPDVLSRVFDPTFTTKPRGEGLGLGLPLAKHIVAGHGGSIEAPSTSSRSRMRSTPSGEPSGRSRRSGGRESCSAERRPRTPSPGSFRTPRPGGCSSPW